ncbi:hypothetical protein G5C51_42120, partial [Streptomyces sp. A7024]
PAARHRLATLLADRAANSGAGARRGATPDLTELIPEWLQTANDLGYQAPPALLPALLDAARARTDLRRPALRLGGTRARWLAARNPAWTYALREGADPTTDLCGLTTGEALDPTANTDEFDPTANTPAAQAIRTRWEEGLFAERVALLAALRRRHAPAALRLLATTWRSEKAEDRLAFLDSLRDGLSMADEPFLEQSLDDRSRNVRATAAALLSALPASGLASRMGARAKTHVSLDPTQPPAYPMIIVEAPHECDGPMQRDGIAPKPPSGQGERSWWLGQTVEAAPLRLWTEVFGGRTPEEIVALPVADDWRADLHAAWSRAAARQRDPDWARALLGTPGPDAAPTQDRLSQDRLTQN